MLELARLLTGYCGRMIVHIVPFTKIQEEIRKQCPEEYFTLIMRRFMMRIAQAVAKRPGPMPWSRANPWVRWPARPCWPWA